MQAHNYVQWTLIKMLLLPCRTGWPGPGHGPGLGLGLVWSGLLQLVVECAEVGGGGRLPGSGRLVPGLLWDMVHGVVDAFGL